MDLNQLYDQQTVEVMRRTMSPDSNGIDVGCHRGSMLRELRRVAPKGLHLAFEPLPSMFAHLVLDFGADSHVQLHNLALSDTSGLTTFQHVVTSPGYSGLRRRRYDREHEQVEEIKVRTELLDHIVPATMAIKFIKIDVEGAELQVLRGAVGTIRRCKPAIVFEHGLGAADCYGTTPEDVFDLLNRECGLNCFLMGDWLATNGRKHLSREQFADEFRSGRNFYFMAAKASVEQ